MKNKFTKYQQWIIGEMKKGAVIKCTEGNDYKVWLEYINGDKIIIRRNSANIITSIEDCEGYFTFRDEIAMIKEPK